MDKYNLPQLIAPEPGVFLQQAKERIAGYAKNSKAGNTWKAYQSDFDDFSKWCSEHGLSFLPAAPEAVAAYLIYLAPIRKVATIQRRIASIS
jgi:site-specific recombinase XerD